MVNAWSLLDSVLKGTLDEDFPIMKKIDKDVIVLGGEENKDKDKDIDIDLSGIGTGTYEVPFNDDFEWGDDGFSVTGNPTASPDTITFSSNAQAAGTVDFGGSHLLGGMGEDHISFSGYGNTAYDDPKYYATKPQPDLKSGSTHKYQEDKGIADLKSYVASTYQGHYTNKNSDTQTLDLIHSVGDAESFCRSNAIKYLSRYDKKGSAKNDILKAMHYCLLLYYFSGNTQEPDYTNTRYETF